MDKETIIKYHNHILQIMARLEGISSRQIKPMINRQYMDVATLIVHGVKDIDRIVDNQNSRLRKILREQYQRTANVAGRQATNFFDPKKSMGDGFWQAIDQFIALYTGRKITQMQTTTKKMITSAIKKGTEEGETNKEIATRLRKIGRVDSNYRAIRIARTETHGMFNYATDMSIRDTGLKFERTWSTTIDQRTRVRKKGSFYDHLVVNGQKRKQDEPFLVSGQLLMYPGDPNGSAGNIINCRCILTYEPVRSNIRGRG